VRIIALYVLSIT